MADKYASIERQEQIILEQVKFIDLMLEEIRIRNTSLQVDLGMSYAKYVGISTPYEECIHTLRKVKKEFDIYLKTARNEVMDRILHRQKECDK
jgi:hypothetical protein